MRSLLKALIYGLAIWILQFATDLSFFSLWLTNHVLFDSITPVLLVMSVVFFAILYFRDVYENPLREGILIGFIWFSICALMDVIFVLPGPPLKMSFVRYLEDIGLTYVIIPSITIGAGFAGTPRLTPRLTPAKKSGK